MRFLLLLSFVLTLAADAAAQATAPAPKPAAPAPAPKPAPAQPRAQTPRRATQPAARTTGIALTVTDPDRATLAGVTVELSGPASRKGETDDAGQVSFPSLQAGTYRLRFSGEAVTAFEREVTLRAGQVTRLDITLNPPPAPKVAAAPAPPPPLPPPPVGPAGEPQVLSVVDLLERELVRNNQPRKDTLVACSGNTRSMLVQLNEAQSTRVYESAEAGYYVVAGEGAINVDGRDVALEAGGFAALPRGTPHAITRKGRRPLILLAILSGEPCEEVR
jgi:mannose-6-phosphate isomerase-like protein (cupin superfamily)